jgi:hypothetical protein
MSPPDEKSWLDQLTDRIAQFLVAVSEARIPPSKMAVVSKQGSMNLVTGLFGIVVYTAAAKINAETRSLSLESQLAMVTIGAVLLFVAAIVVIFTARGPANISDDWKKTTSVFIVVWLLALFVFLILTYPSLLITQGEYILLDHIAYPLGGWLFGDPSAWVYDLLKSLICAFIAGLILIYRTRIADPSFSLRSAGPWVWLVLMTLVIGFVFDISLYLLVRLQS